jgi:hypothetical protein
LAFGSHPMVFHGGCDAEPGWLVRHRAHCNGLTVVEKLWPSWAP